MFGTKKRTYTSKKSEFGAIRHKDILRAVPDTSTLFDALSANNIKKYRKDNSYLFPNKLSTISTGRTKSKILLKTKPVTEIRNHKNSKTDSASLSSSSDSPLRVKHNSIDLFDQLKNSINKNDEAFDNLLNDVRIVGINKLDPRINLSSDSSSYSPPKLESSNESNFQLPLPKKKSSFPRRRKKKHLLELTANGNTSHSINEFNFVVEPLNKNVPCLTPEAIVNCKENLWNNYDSSTNFNSSMEQYKVGNKGFKESLDNSIFGDPSSEIFLPTSTPYSKMVNQSLKDKSSNLDRSPMAELLPQCSIDLFNSSCELDLDKLPPKINLLPDQQSQDEAGSRLSMNVLPENVNSHSSPLQYGDSDSDSSFHGFQSEDENGRPEPLCLGLSPRKRPLMHSPDLFSCFSFEALNVDKKNKSRNENKSTYCSESSQKNNMMTDKSIHNQNGLPKMDLCEPNFKNVDRINKENDGISPKDTGSSKTIHNADSIKQDQSMNPRVLLIRLSPQELTKWNIQTDTPIYKSDVIKSDDLNSIKHDNKSMNPKLLLRRLTSRDLIIHNIQNNQQNHIIGNGDISYYEYHKQLELDDKFTKMTPIVVLTKNTNSNKVNCGAEIDEIVDNNFLKIASLDIDLDGKNEFVYNSPIRLRNKKTVVRDVSRHSVIGKINNQLSIKELTEIDDKMPKVLLTRLPVEANNNTHMNELHHSASSTLDVDNARKNTITEARASDMLTSDPTNVNNMQNCPSVSPENTLLETKFNMTGEAVASANSSLDISLNDTCVISTNRAPRFTSNHKTPNPSILNDEVDVSTIQYPIELCSSNNPMINITRRDTVCRKTVAPRPSIILEPGKRWERCLNILRNVNRNNLTINESINGFNSTILNNTLRKGRLYNHNVTHLLELQNNEDERNSSSDVSHYFHDGLSNMSRRYSVMIVEEPTLREENFDQSQLSQTSVYTGLYTDSCNDTKVNLSRVSSLSESDCSKRHHSLVLREALVSECIEYQDQDQWNGLSAKDIVLRRCNQSKPLPFDECYPPEKLRKCWKIGEGVYGEVFLYKNEEDPANPIVMKVIPIEGELIVNGDHQKTFGEIISEIVIAMELSDLRFNKENNTSSFNKVNCVRCVQGCYPESLIDLWELYDEQKGSENDNPTIFNEDQLYIVLELANGGQDLEAFRFKDAEQSYYLFFQVAFALAVAEESFQFEHRDLHWGNILVSYSDQKHIKYTLHGEEFSVPTVGIQSCIIDYTLSRITLPTSHLSSARTIYNDLSKDPDLFNADGDYQFDIYRLMKEKNGDSWHHFEPFTNILWLHYTLDKMITALRYERADTRTHELFVSKLNCLKDNILLFDSCVDFVTSKQCFSYLHDA